MLFTDRSMLKDGLRDREVIIPSPIIMNIRDEQQDQFVPIVITKMKRRKILLVADYSIHP
ncbi:hypothetical protein PILCRDRAFT_538247 [Piloderma croceum F 1598]|uniref:Uncharacterized protein n=1 Tax=Piloderma croceum (strain F 1598) TaxID=765440 RepID=A0A0C3BSA4_PILCF|nr:hypothetical protein PILCRDRAFT_538247 [Piloderma croceum F 1598]